MKVVFFALLAALPAMPHSTVTPLRGRTRPAGPVPANGMLIGAGVLLIGALRIRPA